MSGVEASEEGRGGPRLSLTDLNATYAEDVRTEIDWLASAGTLSSEISTRIAALIEEAEFALSAPGFVGYREAREYTGEVSTLEYVRQTLAWIKEARGTEATMRGVETAWDIHGNLCIAEDIADAGLNNREAYGDAEGMAGPGEGGTWNPLGALAHIVYLVGVVSGLRDAESAAFAQRQDAEAAEAAQLAGAAPVETPDRGRRAGWVRRWIAARFSH